MSSYVLAVAKFRKGGQIVNGNMIYNYEWGYLDLPDNDISVLFQRQRTDYVNPTIVQNSFTKTIRVPGTKRNNIIFSGIYHLDMDIGITIKVFNPSIRNPFILMKDGSLVEKGYMKLNNIIYEGGFYYYEITLYGELGNLLYNLSYIVDEDTGDVKTMTLGDLDFGFDGFTINRTFVEAAWKRLSGDPEASGKEYENFDTLNFAVCYDGIPTANNFEAKKVWTATYRKCMVKWDDVIYAYDDFPSSVVKDDVTYSAIPTAMTQSEPSDDYGLLETKNGLTPLQTRDLRAYLLRPVIKLSKVFDAIGRYIGGLGYSLDMSDPYFSSDDFQDAWITLSMLYEINPDVETGTRFTKEELLKNTGTPASYLISYCKIYGIYMDVDYASKMFRLTRMPRFFDGPVNELKIDESRGFKVNPLSFDKATYTFDMGSGDGEFLKKYEDSYGFHYGSKKVNTGYRFDASSAPYIDNNIYREAADCLEQSIYYKYSSYLSPFVIRPVPYSFPQELMDEADPPTYSLFSYDRINATINDTLSAKMTPVYNNRMYGYFGYQMQDTRWAGLQKDVWQDGFPKVQFHKEDNKACDGKDVLLFFNGFRKTEFGYPTVDSDKNVTFNRMEWTGDEYVHYLLSDDLPILKYYIGKNAYYDNPYPAADYGPSLYLTVIEDLPMFTRGRYDLDYDINRDVDGKYDYLIYNTLDFGVPVEIFVPATDVSQGIGVYDRFWSRYISDVYSVNTRILEGYCNLDNIDKVFRQFYYYDNCLWILSKVVDWDPNTKWCRGTFIKVNDRNNYIS